MSFWVFYFLALIPLAAGGLLFIFNQRINWIEWLSGAAIALLVAGIAHICAIKGMTDDVETLSGQVVSVTYHPYWVQEHHYTTTSTDSKGHVTIHHHTIYIPHPEHWTAEDSLSQIIGIERRLFDRLKLVLGETVDKRYAGHYEFYSGDNHTYVTLNTTKYLEPTTMLQTWTNRVKGTPSTFSFLTPPKSIKVFPYPENSDRFKSDRLVGSAVLLDFYAFDRMNSRLGPVKKVNVIFVGMGDVPESNAQWQEAAWLRGKQNDLVVCWGGANSRPTWVKTFSWGGGVALKSLESILLEKGINDSILPEVEREIMTGFQHADWHRLDYLSVEIPMRYVIYYLIFMVLTQGAFWWYAHANEYDKEDRRWRFQ